MDHYTWAETGWYFWGWVIVVTTPLGAIIGGIVGFLLVRRSAEH